MSGASSLLPRSKAVYSKAAVRWASFVVGDSQTEQSTGHIVGFMRFDSDDKQAVLDLLKLHPVVVHDGSVELCEMPKS